jgi:hypothetical protein
LAVFFSFPKIKKVGFSWGDRIFAFSAGQNYSQETVFKIFILFQNLKDDFLQIFELVWVSRSRVLADFKNLFKWSRKRKGFPLTISKKSKTPYPRKKPRSFGETKVSDSFKNFPLA